VPELETLLGRVETDAGFGSLLQACAAHDVPAHIISDGFDYCIRGILARTAAAVQPLVGRMQVCASHLEPCGDNGWQTRFPFYAEPCAHGCATCKPAVMQALNPSGGPTVFVGDGLSDRYAAAAADVVFAKDKLAVYCAEQGIPHVRYASLADVAAYMDEAMRSGRMWRRATAARARA
jgi:2-hydroxy-3-keto-5-methylthiopentenyl-1-phosphate phosphatase